MLTSRKAFLTILAPRITLRIPGGNAPEGVPTQNSAAALRDEEFRKDLNAEIVSSIACGALGGRPVSEISLKAVPDVTDDFAYLMQAHLPRTRSESETSSFRSGGFHPCRAFDQSISFPVGAASLHFLDSFACVSPSFAIRESPPLISSAGGRGLPSDADFLPIFFFRDCIFQFKHYQRNEDFAEYYRRGFLMEG